jgi:hypothetical protein
MMSCGTCSPPSLGEFTIYDLRFTSALVCGAAIGNRQSAIVIGCNLPPVLLKEPVE